MYTNPVETVIEIHGNYFAKYEGKAREILEALLETTDFENRITTGINDA